MNYDALYIDVIIKDIADNELKYDLTSRTQIERFISTSIDFENFSKVPRPPKTGIHDVLLHLRRAFRGKPNKIMKADIKSKEVVNREIVFRTSCLGLAKCKVVVTAHYCEVDTSEVFYTFYVEKI